MALLKVKYDSVQNYTSEQKLRSELHSSFLLTSSVENRFFTVLGFEFCLIHLVLNGNGKTADIVKEVNDFIITSQNENQQSYS